MRKFRAILKRSLCILLVFAMGMTLLVGCGEEEEEKETKKHKNKKHTEQEADEKEGIDLGDLGNLIGDALGEGEGEEEPDVPQISAKQLWEGTWFGCLVFGDCTGKFEKSSGGEYANYLVLNFDDDNTGKFTISNSWNEYGNGEFEVVDNVLQMTGGTVFDSPLNTDNWVFEEIDSYGRKIIMEDSITDVDGDVLEYFIWLKPWGADWSEMASTELYDAIFKPYEDKLSGKQNPPYGFINEFINDPANAADIASALSGSGDGSGKDDGKDSGKDDGKDAGGESGGLDIPAVDSKNYVIVDNEYVKIVCEGPGVYEYNDSWIGYNLIITNKCDYAIHIDSQKDENDDPNLGGGSDECFYKGKVTRTHFGASINEKIEDYELTLAVDGITDVKDVEDVAGYIHVSVDKNGDLIGFYPYHFK